MTVLVTGAAGFIGYHLSAYLLKNSYNVIGIDNLNNYYDISLKEARINRLKDVSGFLFRKVDIIDKEKVDSLFDEFGIDYVSEVLKKCIRNSIKELINDKKGLHFCILSKRSCGYEVSKGLYLCDCVKSIDSTIEEIQSFNFVGTAWTNRHT